MEFEIVDGVLLPESVKFDFLQTTKRPVATAI